MITKHRTIFSAQGVPDRSSTLSKPSPSTLELSTLRLGAVSAIETSKTCSRPTKKPTIPKLGASSAIKISYQINCSRSTKKLSTTKLGARSAINISIQGNRSKATKIQTTPQLGAISAVVISSQKTCSRSTKIQPAAGPLSRRRKHPPHNGRPRIALIASYNASPQITSEYIGISCTGAVTLGTAITNLRHKAARALRIKPEGIALIAKSVTSPRNGFKSTLIAPTIKGPQPPRRSLAGSQSNMFLHCSITLLRTSTTASVLAPLLRNPRLAKLRR